MAAKLTYYRKIFKSVERGEISCLYLLHGPESFIMEELAGRIADAAVPAELRSFNLEIAYGGEMDIDSFLTTASSFPFLADRRVLILKGLEKSRGSWKKLIAYCTNPAPSSTLILLYNPYDGRGRKVKSSKDFKKLESVVRSGGKVIQFDRLGDEDLRRWICSKAKRTGVELDGEAVKTLIRSVGENLYELNNELEKIALLFDKGRIVRADLERVLGVYRMDAVFDLVNSIRPGGEAAAIRIMSRIIETGAEKPSVVLYHLIRHFLALLKIKSGRGVGEFGFGRLKQKAGLFSTRSIILWLENLRQAELVMKSVSFPDELILFGTLICSMKGEMLDIGSDYGSPM